MVDHGVFAVLVLINLKLGLFGISGGLRLLFYSVVTAVMATVCNN